MSWTSVWSAPARVLRGTRCLPLLGILATSATMAAEVGEPGTPEHTAYNQAVSLTMDAEEARRQGELPVVTTKTGEAIEDLRALVAAGHPLAQSTLAHALYVGFRFQEAVDAFDVALKEPGPTAHMEHAERGVSLCVLGRLDEADRAFDKAVVLAPEGVDMAGFIAHELWLLGLILEAMADQAEAKDPGAPNSNRAVALAMYERALALAPGDRSFSRRRVRELRKKLKK